MDSNNETLQLEGERTDEMFDHSISETKEVHVNDDDSDDGKGEETCEQEEQMEISSEEESTEEYEQEDGHGRPGPAGGKVDGNGHPGEAPPPAFISADPFFHAIYKNDFQAFEPLFYERITNQHEKMRMMANFDASHDTWTNTETNKFQLLDQRYKEQQVQYEQNTKLPSMRSCTDLIRNSICEFYFIVACKTLKNYEYPEYPDYETHYDELLLHIDHNNARLHNIFLHLRSYVPLYDIIDKYGTSKKIFHPFFTNHQFNFPKAWQHQYTIDVRAEFNECPKKQQVTLEDLCTEANEGMLPSAMFVLMAHFYHKDKADTMVDKYPLPPQLRKFIERYNDDLTRRKLDMDFRRQSPRLLEKKYKLCRDPFQL